MMMAFNESVNIATEEFLILVKLKHIGLFITGALLCFLTGMLVSGAEADDGQWVGEPVTIREVAIQVEDEYPDGFDWPAWAKALIHLNQGDTLTPAKLERAIDVLKPFARVETKVLGGRLTFTLQPFKRIKSMAIVGNYPLFEQDVHNVLTIAPGVIFKPAVVPEQENLVVQRFKSEGYIDPKVHISWEQDPQDGHYHLSIVIDKGPFYALRRVRLTGNHSIADAVLIAQMSTWRRATIWFGKGRFVAHQLKIDIDQLTAYYRKQGFADVVVSYGISPDKQRRRVSIDVTIEEGHRYAVTLDGNKFFSDGQLEKELELFTVGNRGNVGLRRSIQNIRRRYLKAGYADVQVRWQEIKPSEARNQRSIHVQIEEGLRYIVRDVTVQGNVFLDNKTIKEQLLTRPSKGLESGAFVAEVLQEDLASVQALYLKYGFLKITISEDVQIHPASKEVKVAIVIQEGAQTRVEKITLDGDAPVPVAQLQSVLQLKSGDLFRPYMVSSDENKLSTTIAPLGYPYVRVKGAVSLSEDQTRAQIVYTIIPGPLVSVGPIFFAGNIRTRTKLLAREMGFKQGAPFDLSKVLAAQRNLRNMDLFGSVQVRTIGLKEKEATIPLLVETVEKKPYFFEVGGGYETDKGPFIRTKIGDRNFRGTNRQIWTGGEVSGIGYRWDTGMTDPRLLGSLIRADLGLFIEHEEEFNQDFGTDSGGSTLNLSRRLSRTVTATLGWRYERREQFLREQDASTTDVDSETLEPRKILVTTPTLRYDSRDSFIRPRKGWYSSISVDFSRGLDNDLDDFIKYTFDLRTYHTPYSRLTLAGMARVGYLTAYGDNTQVPEDQLFFLGGTTDVRGYGENLLRFDTEGDPLGGRLALSASLEARYDLGRNFEFTTFVDAGTIEKTLSDEGQDQWRWSVGLGLRYMTPIGPIGLLYGRKIDPRPEEDNGQFHFTIGYTF